jgi:hypothetical protein
MNAPQAAEDAEDGDGSVSGEDDQVVQAEGDEEPMVYGAEYRGTLECDPEDHEWEVNEIARLLAQNGWSTVTTFATGDPAVYRFRGRWHGREGMPSQVDIDEPALHYGAIVRVEKRRAASAVTPVNGKRISAIRGHAVVGGLDPLLARTLTPMRNRG